MSDAGDRCGVDIGTPDELPEEFAVDPRDLGRMDPAVVRERHHDDTTTKIGVANVSLHDSGALHYIEWTGRQGVLPQWRWADLEYLRVEQVEGCKRVALLDWGKLPADLYEALDIPHDDLSAFDGGDRR